MLHNNDNKRGPFLFVILIITLQRSLMQVEAKKTKFNKKKNCSLWSAVMNVNSAVTCQKQVTENCLWKKYIKI